jgi:nicotinamide phosphoribosyltransferase
MTIENIFSPKATDVAFTQDSQLVISLICRLDSYKFSHPFAYPAGIEGMSSYGEARVPFTEDIVPAGMQLLTKRYLSQTITMADIDAAEAFTEAHFGRKLFARDAWEKVVNVYGGKLPLIIRAVPEGTVMRGGLPIYNVTVLDKDLAWMSAGFETMIQRGIWYPTTIATMDRRIKQAIAQFYKQTGADMNMLPFVLHDFGGRGVSSGETAEIGGFAHLINFMGSDTVEGILAANFYYKEPMAGFSVYATEHSIECSFGGGTEDAKAYIRHQLQTAKELGISIVSIVIDGYDVYREAELLCTEFKDDIIASGVKVVFRPDSGDMMEVVPRILKLQEAAFGTTLTEQGYKKINNVGVIQGDGVDHLAIKQLLSKVTNVYRYSADVVIFGSGGALLQKVNRDTFKFAQKASAILKNGEWIGIAKNPVTDSGKKSKEGVLTTVRSKVTGELMAARLDNGPLDSEWGDIMQLVYFKGQLFNETTLAEVRARAAV